MDKLAPHNGVRDSVSQVKHGVVPGRFTPLLGETCPLGGPVTDSTGGGNVSVQLGHEDTRARSW